MSNLITQAANRYIVWNRKKTQYKMWRNKFMVSCRSRGVSDGFEINEEDVLKLKLKEATEDTKKEIKEYELMNDRSFEQLVNSIDHNKSDGTTALQYCFGAVTEVFENGSAKLALGRLDTRYDSKDIMNQEQL